VSPADSHWNERGTAIAAEQIAELIHKADLLSVSAGTPPTTSRDNIRRISHTAPSSGN
jgi:hypothetical protein